jgi:hypothetical protein
MTRGAVSKSTRRAVFERDGFACKNCGRTKDLCIDHIVARSKGGTDDPGNLQVLCRVCNSSKFNNASGEAEARRIVGIRMWPDGCAHVDALATEANVNRSEMIRIMLAYASAHMPRGWRPR